MKKILITGGAGYIGVATAQYFLKKRFKVYVVDNLSTGKNLLNGKNYFFIKSDFSNKKITKLLIDKNIKVVIHLAASIDNNESILRPKKYFLNNYLKVKKFIKNCENAKIKYFIFSSSAAVYGKIDIYKPINEKFRSKPITPYGKSKLMTEKLLKNTKFKSIILRYFNVAGPTFGNLYRQNFNGYKHLLKKLDDMKFSKKINFFKINGNNYDTYDGTCVRDFIHVQDIAKINYKAFCLSNKLLKKNKFRIFNCGTSVEKSVLEIVKKFSYFSKIKFKIKFAKRRKGDTAFLLSDNKLLKNSFGLKLLGIDKIIKDLVK